MSKWSWYVHVLDRCFTVSNMHCIQYIKHMNVKTTTTIKWVGVKNKETSDKVKNDIIKGKVYIWQPLLKLIERHVKTCG